MRSFITLQIQMKLSEDRSENGYGFQRPRLKTGVENGIVWSEIQRGHDLENRAAHPYRAFEEYPHPPDIRILHHRCIVCWNSCTALNLHFFVSFDKANRAYLFISYCEQERMKRVVNGRLSLIVIPNVPFKSKLQHPPRATPGHLNFWKISVQIPPSPGQTAVQMPPPRGNNPFYLI